MLKRLHKYIFWLGLLLLPNSVNSQYVYDIVDSMDQHIFVYEFIEYLEDPTGKLTFDEVRSPEISPQFLASEEFTPDNYNFTSAYWYRITIRHHKESQKKWLLEFFDQTIDSISAYIPDKSGSYRMLALGDAKGFDDRRFKHKNFVIPIENDHNEELTYYFRVKADHPVNVILVVRSFDFFSFYALNEYFYFGIFYGLIILIALYNLLLYFAIRDIPYLYFVLYALSVGLFFSSSDGFAYQYVWPQLPRWNEVAYAFFMYTLVIFALLFTKQFLHLKNKSPRINRALNGLIIVRSLYFLVCLVIVPTWFDYFVVDMIPLLIILAVSIYFLNRGYKPARLFMLAFAFLTIGAITKLLLTTGFGNIGSGVINYYALNITFLMQLIALSLSLGDKVRILKEKKDRAMKRIVAQHEINSRLQTKVNRELEQKVKERTSEIEFRNEQLAEANQKLEDQAEEINKMNQLLDKDNWNIKKETKKEIRNRLLSSGVSYEEFRSIFPDDKSCLQYLASLKWEDGFSCKKCNHERAIDDHSLSMRCSRCGYTESVTAHTIFHNVRFPLQKAFYISHIEISGTRMTIKELSEILDLRAATCSSFRQKVRASHLASSSNSRKKSADLIVYSDT